MYFWAQTVSGAEALAKIVEYWASVIIETAVDGQVRLAIGGNGEIAIEKPEEE
jgi:hypothetical protein